MRSAAAACSRDAKLLCYRTGMSAASFGVWEGVSVAAGGFSSVWRRCTGAAKRVKGRVRAMRARLAQRLPVLSQAWRISADAEVIDRAGSLAMFAIFAAVPAMFGAFSALGFVFNTVDDVATLANVTVPSQQGVIARISQMVQESLPGVSWDPAKMAAALVRHRTINGVFGTVGAVVLGMGVFSRFDAAIRALFACRKRSAWRAAGLMGLVFLVGSLLAMVLAVAAPLTEWGLGVAAQSVSSLSLGWLDGVAIAVAATQILPVAVGFFILVRWSAGRGQVLNRRLGLMSIGYGAMWFLGQRVFSLYVSEIVKMDAIYGALTGVVALMMWLYYATVAFLFAVATLAAWEQVSRRKLIADP